MGDSANAYQVTGGEWDPTTIQWTNKPAANVLLQSNISNNDRTKYQFSVLTAVRHWYDGDPTGQNENYGIMLRYYDESLTGYYNSFYSGDVVDTNSRPKLTISYNPPNNSVDVGDTLALSVSGASGTVTWTSSNTAVATVNSSGVVTGVKVGGVTITASVNGSVFETFTVYVTVADGVYYIKNTSFAKYLSTTGGVAEQTWTTLKSKSTSGLSQLQQLWKIVYLGNGYYSIRPMYALSMALHATSNTVDIVTVGTTDSLTAVPLVSRWGIEAVSSGYTFKHTGTSSLKMGASVSYSEYHVTTGNYASGATASYWTLEKVSSVTTQVLLLDTQTGTSAANRTVYLEPGQTMTLADLQMKASVVCMNSLSQYITWYSDSNSVRVDSLTGAITAMTPGGDATISAKHYNGGTAYQVNYNVYVKPIPDGTYYLRSQIYNRYLQVDNDDASNNYSTSGAIMEQWEFSHGDHQKWVIQWRGDGYYSIISSKSGKALTVPSGQTESADVALVQQPYTGNDRQKWKITITDDHYYKIKAKSSEGASDDLVMAVGDSLLNDSDGVHIEQRIYLNRDDKYYNHFDKWFICSLVDIGMSTDNYTKAPDSRERQSYLYATTFWDGLNDGNPFFCEHHYNKDSTYMASEADFAENGAMSVDTDFMIYIGHGHVAHRGQDSQHPEESWGNHIQYGYSTGGEVDLSVVCTTRDDAAEIDQFCLYTSEVRFGSRETDLRWVWMYTCNFLNTNEYVLDSDLKEMMTGAHIVMGYGTQSLLCKPNVEAFAKHLRNGERIIDAFFWAGRYGEATCTTDNHLQRVLYIPQAEFETIYSPQIHYNYEPEDVRIGEQWIQDSNEW